jgi:hypothetical protein
MQRFVVCRLPLVVVLMVSTFLPGVSLCQTPSPNASPNSVSPSNNGQPAPEPKRIFWIIPNRRSSPSLINYKPLTTKEKFKMATGDSFDYGTALLGAVDGGVSQATNASPSFGQGVKGYAQYFGTSYGTLVIGDYMTEAIYPSMLRQDPRYFRRGTGRTRTRLGYACSRMLVSHRDSDGSTQFNYSEILGNSTAVAISQAYYPDNRTASDALKSLAVQLGYDLGGNILKEFWPDVYRKLRRHPKVPQP